MEKHQANEHSTGILGIGLVLVVFSWWKNLFSSIVSLIVQLLDAQVPEWCRLPGTVMGNYLA